MRTSALTRERKTLMWPCMRLTLRLCSGQGPCEVSLPANFLTIVIASQSGGIVRLDRGTAERLVLAAARDHFYAADTLDAPGVAAAQRCLALLPDSPAARAESDAIAALLRLHREHKYAMLPAAFKQVR